MTPGTSQPRTEKNGFAHKEMFLAVIDDLRPVDDSTKFSVLQTFTSDDLAQEEPIYFRSGEDIVAGLKIDTIKITNRKIEILGWYAGEIQVQLLCNGQPLEQNVTHNLRPDIAEIIKWPEPEEGFGFTLKAGVTKAKKNQYIVQIQIKDGEQTHSFQRALELDKFVTLGKTSPGNARAVGYLELAAASVLIQEAIVVGWVIHDPGVKVWLENEDGDRYSLNNAFRIKRQDVFDAFAKNFGNDAREGGFIILVPGMLLTEKIRLMAMSGSESIVLGTVECSSLEATSTACARWLFGIATPLSQSAKKVTSH